MREKLASIIRQRPFVPAALLLSLGIVAARETGSSVTAAATLVCFALPLLLIVPLRASAVAILIFALGGGLYAARYEIFSASDLRLIFEEKPALVIVRGRLMETPALKEFPGKTNVLRISYARLDVTEVLFERQWRPAKGQVASTTRGVFGGDFFQGRTVEVSGIIERPKAAVAPGLFDFRKYLYNSRVHYQLRCESTNDWQLTSHAPMPLAEKFQRWANSQLARGLPREDQSLELLRAMALGTTQSLTGEVADVFMRTGTMHIFAISGLHVACIAACILWGLRMAGVPRDRAAWILIPLLWFYTLATGWQSSAVRSALMSTFVFAGWALRRPTELLNSLAGAAVLILLFEPEQLFQASFQLSFAVVAAIALLLGRSRDLEPWPMRLQDRLLGYDPLLPAELRPRWKKLLEVPIAFLLGNLAISGASWIGSNPLTAYYFNMVTPISLVANLLAVPLSSLSLAMTLGSLLLPPLGPVFNYISWATMWATIAVTRWLSHLSWGYFYVPKPNLWFFIAYFAVAGICTIPPLSLPNVRRFSFSFAGLAVIVWLCSILPASRSTLVTILPARGNPVVIDTPGRAEDLLVDCSNAHGAEQLVKRFLRGHGFGSMRNILLTHGDVNHAGGLPLLRKEFSPRAVFATATRGRSRVYHEVLSDIEATPGLLRSVATGDKFPGGTILHPSSGQKFTRADDSAVVFRTDLHGWRMLFLSELGALGRKALLERTDLHADILLCGPTEAASEEIVAMVSPRLLVVGGVDASFGKFRSRDRPKPLNKVLTVSSSPESAVTLALNARFCRVETAEGWFALER